MADLTEVAETLGSSQVDAQTENVMTSAVDSL